VSKDRTVKSRIEISGAVVQNAVPTIDSPMIAMRTRPAAPSQMSEREMYDLVEKRDASAIGLFFLGVKTTGIFCRPGCPARTPNFENCEFFKTPAGAMQAGYRSCMRCKPLVGVGVPDWAEKLAEILELDPPKLVTAAQIRALGVHPATASRFFKKHMGSTIQALSRARRVGAALAWVREGARVPSAAMRAGFESESGFRKAATELFGDSANGDVEPLAARWLTTPMGPMVAVASDRGLCLLEFLDRRMLETNFRALRTRVGKPIAPGQNAFLDQIERELAEYFAGKRRDFDVPLHTAGTEFQSMVWQQLQKIPYGETCSYQQLARAIGKPSAVRAVARANGDNRLAIVIPCHRVIGADGSLTGYGGGVDRKERLLAIENPEAWGGGLFGSGSE
jgi:AraC family transcriptional regulator of adaptative response/methylated-DNA-[protein]-cysteine methyltransferase